MRWQLLFIICWFHRPLQNACVWRPKRFFFPSCKTKLLEITAVVGEVHCLCVLRDLVHHIWFGSMACVSLWGRVGRLAPSITQRMGWKRAGQAGCSCHTKDGRGRVMLPVPDTQRMEEGGSSWLLLTHKGRKRAGHAACS